MIFTVPLKLITIISKRMTQNQHRISDQKIQTACPYGRNKRSIGTGGFFVLNDGQTKYTYSMTLVRTEIRLMVYHNIV